MDTIKALLDTVRINGSTGDTSLMARDIAGYERLLALVSNVSTQILTMLNCVYRTQ